MPKTIGEIREAFSRSIGGVLSTYQDELDRVKAIRDPEAGGYLDRLSPEGRMSLLREQKQAKGQEIAQKSLEDYLSEVKDYGEALAKRRRELKERLFKVEDARLITDALRANRDELLDMLEVAQQAGSTELARAVLLVSDKKHLGDVMTAYFDNVDPEARELYQEWTEIPSEEELERMAENAQQVIVAPSAEELVPTLMY